MSLVSCAFSAIPIIYHSWNSQNFFYLSLLFFYILSSIIFIMPDTLFRQTIRAVTCTRHIIIARE